MIKGAHVFFALLLLAGLGLAESMRVQVQTGQVRGTPSFLGPVVASVPYGQPVEVLAVQEPWRQVRTAEGKTGWMHASALTAKRIAAQGSGSAVSAGASGDELALAGKGFNADVEAKFKAEHADIDFSWVDKMSKMSATASQLAEFAKAGGLKQSGGAQ